MLQSLATVQPRPIAVWVFSILFIAAGLFGLAYHFNELKMQTFGLVTLLILLLRLLAVVSGIFLFIGHNWARWLLAAWLALHVVISAFNSLEQALAHLVLLALVIYFLWRPEVSSFLRRSAPSR